MLTITLVLALAAVVALALGGKEATPAKTVTYGEFPGITDFQKALVEKGTGWLNQPGTYPGMSEAGSLWAGSQPNAWAGGARLGEMLAPGWLTTPGTGLNAITSGMTATQQRNLAESERALRMEFGAAGQQLSSPEFAALSTTRQTSNDALNQAIGGLQYQDYASRLGMLPQLIQMAMTDPYRAAAMLGENGAQMVQMLLALATGGRGDMQIIPGMPSEPGWLENLLGTAVGAAAGGAGGAWGKSLIPA